MTSKKQSLRAVSDDERAPKVPSKPESVTAALDMDARAVNIALQERIAKAIDSPDIRGADLAALSRRLHELRKENATMDAQEKAEAELAKQEAARSGGTGRTFTPEAI